MAEGPVDPTIDPTKRSALQDEVEDVQDIEDATPLEHESTSDLGEEQFRHAKALCRGIKKVVMAANLYEPDHALMEGFFMELHGKMGAYLDLYHEFLLDVSSEELRLQGTTVFRVDQRETGITHRLFLEGVRHIGFHEGIPLEEVKSMILLWSRSLYEDETDDQNFATRFWDLELSFVTAATLDAFSEDAAISREEKDKREEDIEAMLRSILEGSKELEGEKFGLGPDELPAYARPDLRDLVIEYRGMSPEELAQKWTVDDIDITQADRDGYAQRIVSDEMSVVQRALRAMLGSLTRGDATERERVLDLTTRVLGALVARGHPTEAAQAVAQLNLIFQNDEWISNDARQIVREAVTSDKVLMPAIKLLDNPPTARVASSILNNALASRVDVMVTRLRAFKTPEGRRLLASLVKVREPTPEMLKTLIEKSDLDMYEEALFIADGGDMQIVDQVWRSGLIHPNVAIRRRALKSVPKPRVMVLRDALHPLLNDAEKDIRTQVRDLIVSARDQGSIERFARIFNNARLHEDERRTAITAVATIGGPEASRVLMQGLAELNMPDLRVACALALGNHGDATAIPLLESIANKMVTWKSVRDACKEAVHRIQLRSGGTQTRSVAASSIRSRAQQPGGAPKAATSRAAAPKKSLDELPPKIIRMIEEGLIPIPKGYEARKVEAKPTTMKASRQAVLMPATGGSLFDRAPVVSQTIKPAEDATSRKEKKVGGSDLDIVFDGYFMFQEKGEVIFGRRWGAQLTDVHAYAAPDIRVAYAHFLIDKIREEFLPQNERQRLILPSYTLNKLDLQLLDLVYAEVKDGAKKGPEK
jgi:hypothetical protein